MINRENLVWYTKIFERYNNNPNFVFSERERDFINMINKETRDNERLSKLLEDLKRNNNTDILIDNYFKEVLEEKKNNNEFEVIASVYGIDVSKIEHKFLDNGKEIFCFYDDNLSRNVILENNKNGIPLIEQLKEIQKENIEYQTNNEEKNAQNIMEDKSLKENCEIKLIAINEVGEHLNQVQSLKKEDYYRLHFLIENAFILGVNYINLENIIGVSKEGKIYEVCSDSTYQYRISEPDSVNYASEEVNNLEDSFNDYSVSEDEYVDVEITFDDLEQDIQEMTIMFYEFPMEFDRLPTEEKEVWRKYISLYCDKLENELEREKSMPKVRKYIKEKEDNFGYINFNNLIFIVALVITIIFSVTIIVK